jgi:hypothetical protein
MSDETDLLAAGFQIDKRDDYWIFSGSGLSFKHWPKTETWMVFGRTFQATPKAINGATAANKFTMPANASAAKCRKCNADIWWSKTRRGKWIPLESDGCSHFGRCQS